MTELAERTATITSDPIAEMTTLAGMLNQPRSVEPARRLLRPDSFYDARHALVFTICCELDDARKELGPFAIYDALRDRGELDRFGATYIHDLWSYPALGWEWAIRRVASLARQRERAVLALRIGQTAQEVTDPDVMTDVLAKQVVDLLILVDDPDPEEPLPGMVTFDEFVHRPPRPADVLVPGLLDRQEVVMILAAPGVGKSWLSRQVALTVAAGVHPFDGERRIPRIRSLLVDLENPESTVQRQITDPYHAIRYLAGGIAEIGDGAWFWPHTEGLNIRKRADAALLERAIADTKPDLVCIGSLYNLFQRGSSDWDTAAEETIAVLNRLRARYRCAFWIEHHMPRASEGGHRSSPFGSTLWERWPSYGRVIKRISGDAYEFEVFRGDREAGREFPAGLQRGGRKLPWMPIWLPEDLDRVKEALELEGKR